MALSETLMTTLDEQMNLVLAIEDAAVTEAAKKIAFYVAMIDAALDDPMDDPDEQIEIINYFESCLAELTDTYQQLVNSHM